MATAEGGRVYPGRLAFATVDRSLIGPMVGVLLVLVTRLPLATQYLLNWDAVQFALGLQHFDVAHHEPHPPGYIGYEALGKLLTLVFKDANTALVAMSIAGECTGVALAFLFARRLFGEFAAWATMLALIASPLYWYYGEAANTYALEPLLTVVIAWCCWELWEGKAAAAYGAAVAMAAAGAIRPSTMVLLFPLCLVGLWRLRGPDIAVRALALGAVGVAVWAVPLLILTGGPLAYLHASLQLGATVTAGTAIWAQGVDGILTTANAIALGLGLELGLFSVALVAAFVAIPLFYWRRAPMPRDWWLFCLVWTIPALLTFLLVHIGQVVYVQVFTLAFFLCVGPALKLTLEAVGRAPLAPTALFVAVVFNAATFFLPVHTSLAAQLRAQDEQTVALTQAVSAYNPGRSILLTDASGPGSNYREVQYYLPAFNRVGMGQDNQGRFGEIYGDVYDLSGFQRARSLDVTSHVDTFIVVDPQLVSDYVGDPERMRHIKLTRGSIYVWHGAAPVVENGQLWFGTRYRERRGTA